MDIKCCKICLNVINFTSITQKAQGTYVFLKAGMLVLQARLSVVQNFVSLTSSLGSQLVR